MIASIRRNLAGSIYILSGLIKTLALAISGFVILRWLRPEDLGQWQSFTVFMGYFQILTLGITSGLNRELPYSLGKGDTISSLKMVSAAGFYTRILSVGLTMLVIILAVSLYLFNTISIDTMIMVIIAFSSAALSIQTNFLGATYRSQKSFSKLSNLQFANAALSILLIPLAYFFNIWGYIAYQTILVVYLFWGYNIFRPYKIKYEYDPVLIKKIIRIGLPIYVWNYVAQISQSVPRLILVLFGTPFILGLYSPAASVNAAMLNLPAYSNRFLFPQMTYRYGKTNDVGVVYKYAIKASIMLFSVMLLGAIIVSLIIPPTFNYFFPMYIDGIVAAQITLFSGVFFSVSSLIHNALNSIGAKKCFKYIVSLRLLYLAIFTYTSYFFTKDLLIAVACGAVVSEMFNLVNYLYFLRKASKTQDNEH